jgi:transcriptional regulator with GAF, ATPase, and Fis domain
MNNRARQKPTKNALSQLTDAVDVEAKVEARYQILELGQDGLPLSDGSRFIGRSEQIRAFLNKLSLYGSTDWHVLLIAEMGSGKELAARLIHDTSGRKGPLITVNCATLTDSMADAELFGHVKGAFTGATEAKAGVFETAHHGTLFLDEIGHLLPILQGKFLRVLQQGAVRRMGGKQETLFDVRVVAATNRDLFSMAEQGEFQPDLLERFEAILRIPPLRERPDDILPLIAYFLDELIPKLGLSRRPALSPKAERTLLEHDYPGNVRELRRIIRNAALLSQSGHIDEEMIRQIIASRRPSPAASQKLSPDKQRKRKQILEAYKKCDGNIAKAARKLGIAPQLFSYYLKSITHELLTGAS